MSSKKKAVVAQKSKSKGKKGKKKAAPPVVATSTGRDPFGSLIGSTRSRAHHYIAEHSKKGEAKGHQEMCKDLGVSPMFRKHMKALRLQGIVERTPLGYLLTKKGTAIWNGKDSLPVDFVKQM